MFIDWHRPYFSHVLKSHPTFRPFRPFQSNTLTPMSRFHYIFLKFIFWPFYFEIPTTNSLSFSTGINEKGLNPASVTFRPGTPSPRVRPRDHPLPQGLTLFLLSKNSSFGVYSFRSESFPLRHRVLVYRLIVVSTRKTHCRFVFTTEVSERVPTGVEEVKIVMDNGPLYSPSS